MLYLFKKAKLYCKRFDDDGANPENYGFTPCDWAENLYELKDGYAPFFAAVTRQDADFALTINMKNFNVADTAIKDLLEHVDEADLPPVYKVQLRNNLTVKAGLSDKTLIDEFVRLYAEAKAKKREEKNEEPNCDLYDLPCSICGRFAECKAPNKVTTLRPSSLFPGAWE